MKIETVISKIIALKEADDRLRSQLITERKMDSGYHPQMAELHDQNAHALDAIINEIGYPTINKVGAAASEAAWIVIQHSIGQPAFMRRCCELLKEAVEEGMADPLHLAYLTDRIAVFEGRPQIYGTQFDWDDQGELSPQPIDDVSSVNQRRRDIGLNTLEEQTAFIRAQARNENQEAPADWEIRKLEMDAWRREVGWI